MTKKLGAMEFTGGDFMHHPTLPLYLGLPLDWNHPVLLTVHKKYFVSCAHKFCSIAHSCSLSRLNMSRPLTYSALPTVPLNI